MKTLTRKGYLAVCPATSTEVWCTKPRLDTIHEAIKEASRGKPSSGFSALERTAEHMQDYYQTLLSLYTLDLLTPVTLVEWHTDIDRLRRHYNTELAIAYPDHHQLFRLEI